MDTRKAQAKWEGKLKDGKGTFKTGSGAIESTYSFSTRFEDGKGTNPEELIGAAHASCYSMALAAELEKKGHPAKYVDTTAEVTIEKDNGSFKISRIHLVTRASVPGIKDEEFTETAGQAAKGCPVSKALAGTRIEVEAKLA